MPSPKEIKRRKKAILKKRRTPQRQPIRPPITKRYRKEESSYTRKI